MADGAGGPVEKGRTRADRLKDAIAEAILKGELAAGQRLDEVSVAQRFAVSRTPVREALKQLAAMELVDLRPHRGAVVAARSPAGWPSCSRPWARSRPLAPGSPPSRCRDERAQLEIAWAACDDALRAVDLEWVHDPTRISTPRSTGVAQRVSWSTRPMCCGGGWRRFHGPSSA